MNPERLPNQPEEQSVEEWFNQIPGSAPAPVNVAPVPVSNNPQSPKRPRKLIITVSIIGTFLIIAGGVFAFWFFTTKPCLSVKEYEAFTGTTADSQQSIATNFYTSSLTFEDESSAISSEGLDKIDTVSQFYEKYSNDASIIFTVSSNYGSDELMRAASNRASAAKDKLMSLGVSESAIEISEPTKINAGGEISDDELESTIQTYLSISSASTCR